MELAGTHSSRARPGSWRVALPTGVLLSALYAGIHFLLWVGTIVGSPSLEQTLYAGGTGFQTVSIVIGALLLLYLGADLRRWSVAHAHWRSYGYVIYGVAALLVAVVLVFLYRTLSLT